FVTAPRRGELVEDRQCGVRVLRHEQHAEVVVQERVLEHAESDDHEHELPRRRRTRERHPLRFTDSSTRERQHRLHEREAERQDQRELAQLGNHSATVPLVFASASATSGGMYFSSCFASTSSATNVPDLSSAPRATIPCPSRNRSGRTPVYV